MEYTQLKEQEEKFDQIWQKSLRTLSETGVPESTPITSQWTDDKVMLSFWIEPPSEIKSRLAELSAELHDIDQSFTPYTPEAYHASLKNAGIVGKEEADARIKDAISKIGYLPHLPISLDVSGLNMFPTAVISQIYDLDGSLKKLHEHLIRKIDEKPQPFEGPDYIPHMSLGRLGSGAKPKVLIEYLAEKRKSLPIGTFTLEKVDFVKSYGYKSGSKYDLVRSFSI